jgi:hypothetical protein
MTTRTTLAFAFVCLASATVFAADPAPAPADNSAATTQAPDGGKRWKACGDDIQKFCANVEKGKGQMRACLDSHATELSDACKTARAEHASKKDKAAE